jgi:ribosomal protein S18 acetylase RimI-like enzyme
MALEICKADLESAEHQDAIVKLLNLYAMDLQGYKRPLPDSVLEELIPEMEKIPTSLVFLARQDGVYAGMAICFIGFSTFYAQPLINIHDFTVRKEFRGRGIGKKLVEAIEKKAEEIRACKLTLEVQEKNVSAIRLYEACGFERAILDESEGQALFLSKYLTAR